MKKIQQTRIALIRAMSRRFIFAGFSTGMILLCAGLLHAQLINVDFNKNNSAGSGGGPDLGPTMSGAAVLGTAGDQWNSINVSSGNGIPLIDADGNVSTVTMAFTAGGGYDANSYGGSTPFAGTPYNALMEDYLYNNSVPQTIALSGLVPDSIYHLVLYNAADRNAGKRTTYFTVNGNSQSSVWDGSSNTLIAGVDYVEFLSAISDDSGNLVITYNGDGDAEGDIDGFQIQYLPQSAFTINAIYDGTNIVISYLAQAAFSYQVQYKNQLTDASWSLFGNPISGSNAVQSIKDSLRENGRFYRVQMSANRPVALSLLHASGVNIVNAGGGKVSLKGLNLGGWLLMEPWMCPCGGMPDNYSIITNLDRRFGVATEQSLIQTYQTNWITTTDLDNITNGGYNCVRVPVWWGNFYSITNTTSSGWRPDAFNELDWLVANCAARGIYVVIDMHGVIGGQSASDTTGWKNQNRYWTNAVSQNETAYMWTQIAAHYNGNGTVAGYDLLNEPYGAPNTTAVWNAYANLYAAIRAVDKNHAIIMEGAFGSWNWSMLPDPSVYGWTNVIYSMHEYQYSGDATAVLSGSTNQVADFNNHKSWNVPDYIGEWNNMGNGAACYDQTIGLYNSAGIHWTMWAYKAAAGLVPNGWGWYDLVYWPPNPNISSDSSSTISNDWQQWRTTKSFGVNTSVGL